MMSVGNTTYLTRICSMIERDITYNIPVRLYFLYVAFINSRVNKGKSEARLREIENETSTDR